MLSPSHEDLYRLSDQIAEKAHEIEIEGRGNYLNVPADLKSPKAHPFIRKMPSAPVAPGHLRTHTVV